MPRCPGTVKPWASAQLSLSRLPCHAPARCAHRWLPRCAAFVTVLTLRCKDACLQRPAQPGEIVQIRSVKASDLLQAADPPPNGEEVRLLGELDPRPLPQHTAILMD